MSSAFETVTVMVNSLLGNVPPPTKEEAAAAAKLMKEKLAKRPKRPRGLRSEIIRLYVVLAAANFFFVFHSFTLVHPVAEGMFEKRDGSLIKLNDFNPEQLGPYPKCHPKFGQHLGGADGLTWVNNSDIGPKKGEPEDPNFVYPTGHPENKGWKAKKAKLLEGDKWSFTNLMPSLHLLVLSVTIVLLGCKHAVWFYVRPAKEDEKDDVEKDEDVGQSALQNEDAYWFPVVGSCVLFGLFVMLKYVNSEWIKYLFGCYVVIMCANGLGMNIGQIVALQFNSRGLSKFKTLFTIPYFDLPVTLVDIAAYSFAAVLALGYILTKNWIINNIMGISFCILGLKIVGISSYKTGVIMLCGLFLYDIFWVFGSTSVFGSNVMVAVATGIEAPIKLVFPRSQDGCGNMMFSMLGLGDIVVPGITIGLLAKYDISRPDAKTSPGWQYLNWTMVSYFFSLLTTIAVMFIWNHAQPALLYIVPFIIASSFLTSVVKSQVTDLLAFEVEDTMIGFDEALPGKKKAE